MCHVTQLAIALDTGDNYRHLMLQEEQMPWGFQYQLQRH